MEPINSGDGSDEQQDQEQPKPARRRKPRLPPRPPTKRLAKMIAELRRKGILSEQQINLALRLAENDEEDLGDPKLTPEEEAIRAAIVKARAEKVRRGWSDHERESRIIGAPDAVRLFQRSAQMVRKGDSVSDLVGGI